MIPLQNPLFATIYLGNKSQPNIKVEHFRRHGGAVASHQLRKQFESRQGVRFFMQNTATLL
jgi:hypothetical protein